MESKVRGSCACGEVHFEASVDLDRGGARCNCTLCIKFHQSSSYVKPSAFRVTAGEERVVRFRRNPAYEMYRHFCGRCGTQLYGTGHLAELGGDFVSVNLQCLDGVEIDALRIGYWDGRHDNWQAGMRDRPWPIGAS